MMLRTRLQLIGFPLIILPVLLSAVTFSLVLAQTLETQESELMGFSLEFLAQGFRTSYATLEKAGLGTNEYYRSMARRDNLQGVIPSLEGDESVLVVSQKGQLLESTHSLRRGGEVHGDLMGLLESSIPSKGVLTCDLFPSSTALYLVRTYPLAGTGETLVWAKPLERVFRPLTLALGLTGGLTLSFLVGGGVLFFLLARRISQPLSDLVQAVRTYGDNKTPLVGHFHRQDETGLLAREFADLTQKLNQEFEDLETTRKALADSEARLRLALSIGGIITWEVDLVRGTFRIVGEDQQSSESPAQGMEYLLTQVHPTDRPLLEKGWYDIKTGQAPTFDVQHRLLREGGEPRWYRTLGQTVERDSQGQVSKFLGLTMDISPARKAQEDKERLIFELEAKNREMEQFSYTVSHDLQSPLITMMGFLGMVQKDLKEGKMDRLENDLARIQRSGERMKTLIHDLLTLSRIGRVSQPGELCDVQAVLEEVKEILHQPLADKKGHLVVESPLPKVFADRTRLKEVFQNILENALKYSHPDRTPEIRLGGKDTPEGSLFWIQDNGKGIAPEHFQRVFGLFEKLDKNSEGTGVGLALVKRIMENHGGKIWVESPGVGLGATFFLRFPSAGG